MKRRTLQIELAGVGSLVRGHGSRELIVEITGRAPVWLTRLRGWSIQEGTALDVMALAESKGYDIEVTGPRAAPVARRDQEWTPTPGEERLW